MNKAKASSYIAIGGASLFLALLLLLHFLKPENDPSWRLVSEYQIGAYGYLMSIAFFSLATACAAFFFSVRKSVRGVSGKIGLGLLLLAAIGFIIAGIYPSDPIITPRDQLSQTMILHSIGGALAIPAMPLIMTLLGRSLLRKRIDWASSNVKRLLIGLTVTAWVALIIQSVMSSIQSRAPVVEYEWIGYPNRIFIIAFSVWVIVAAVRALRYKTTNK